MMIRSLEALRGHSAQLSHVIRMHSVCIDNCRCTCLLYRLLSYLDTVVDNKQRIVGPQHLVVQRYTVQILFQQRFQHLVVLTQSLLLLLYSQQVQQHLVVTLKKVVQVLELFVLFGSQLLELVLHLLRYLILINCCLVEWQDLLLLSLKTTTQLGSLQSPLPQFKVLLQLLNSIPRVVSQLFESPVFLVSETVHLLFQLLVVLRNIVFLFTEGVISGSTFLFVLKYFQFEKVDFGAFSDDVSVEFVYLQSHIFVIFKVLAMFFCLFASVRGVFLMHLFQFCIVFSLFSFEVELHMLQFLQVFVFDFFPKSLFFSSDLFCFSAVFLLNCFYHIIEFFEMIMMSLFHFRAFSEILLFQDVDITSELFHEPLNA